MRTHLRIFSWLLSPVLAAGVLSPSSAVAVVDLGTVPQGTQLPPAVFQNQPAPAPVAAPTPPPAAAPAAPAQPTGNRVPAPAAQTGAQSPAPATGAQSAQQPAARSSGGGVLQNPLRFDTLEELLLGVLQAVVRIGTIILTLAIIWVGFLFVRAQGNDKKLVEARRALMWTVVGGLLLLGATAIGVAIRDTVDSVLR